MEKKTRKKRTPDQLIITAQKKQITKLYATIKHWQDQGEQWQEQLRASRRECGELVKADEGQKKIISQQTRELGNHEDNLRDIQRDIRSCCEVLYGPGFDPQWNGDHSPPMVQDGVKYIPEYEDIDQEQRLIRMIWRRTHWGLNPMILRDNGISYQTPR